MNHPRKSGLLTTLKQLSPKPDEQDQLAYDQILGFTLNKVVDDVANYTHIPIVELPTELDNTLIDLALNVIAERGLLNVVSGDDVGSVISLHEGDVSTTFMNPLDAYKALSAGTTLTTNVYATLSTFRRVIM